LSVLIILWTIPGNYPSFTCSGFVNAPELLDLDLGAGYLTNVFHNAIWDSSSLCHARIVQLASLSENAIQSWLVIWELRDAIRSIADSLSCHRFVLSISA